MKMKLAAAMRRSCKSRMATIAKRFANAGVAESVAKGLRDGGDVVDVCRGRRQARSWYLR